MWQLWLKLVNFGSHFPKDEIHVYTSPHKPNIGLYVSLVNLMVYISIAVWDINIIKNNIFYYIFFNLAAKINEVGSLLLGLPYTAHLVLCQSAWLQSGYLLRYLKETKQIRYVIYSLIQYEPKNNEHLILVPELISSSILLNIFTLYTNLIPVSM